jgi:hypothetical protein
MKKSPSPINQDEFKLGERAPALIRDYLALTEERAGEIAHLAAVMAPKISGKFNSTSLVGRALLLDASARERLASERSAVIGRMNLNTLLDLHRRLHGKDDRDYLAENNPERLSDPLAGPLVERMQDVAEVRDMIREEKRHEEEKWLAEFAKVANGNPSITLPQALKIVFPRAKNREVYFDEYCRVHGNPLSQGSRTGTTSLTGLRPCPPISFATFIKFAPKLHAAFEANRSAWTKAAQRAGGSKGGMKSAALREAAAKKEAARYLEAMGGEISDPQSKPARRRNH